MNYEQALKRVRVHGRLKPDRTGVGTYSIFGTQIEYDLTRSFPLITTKKIHAKSVLLELQWFLQGGRNMDAQWLRDRDVNIWNSWSNADGKLGPVYGAQWRNWVAPDGTEVDQLQNVVDSLINDPFSRRHVVSAWNPGELDQMALAPCHILFQFDVDRRNNLSLSVYQRSADYFLGVPFDLASYGFLLHIVAKITGYKAHKLIWTGGDSHIYQNHLDQVDIVLDRVLEAPPLPTVKLLDITDNTLDGWSKADLSNFVIENYQPMPSIKGTVAV